MTETPVENYDIDGASRPQLEANAELPGWEMIEPGRYQPRRTRGSCVGRELG